MSSKEVPEDSKTGLSSNVHLNCGVGYSSTSTTLGVAAKMTRGGKRKKIIKRRKN